MKKYNLKIGIPVCAMTAVLVILPRIAQFGDIYEGGRIIVTYFVFSLCSWIGNQYFIQTDYFKKAVHSRLVFLLISMVLGLAFTFLLQYFTMNLSKPYFNFPATGGNQGFIPGILRGTIFNVFNAFLVFHLYQMKEKEQNQLELEHLKQAQLQANMSSLKEQLSPHFLFNTLSTLSTLTKEKLVLDYVQQLSNVYRYLLSYQQKDWVTLKEELDFTESYLYIIKTRLENAINIIVDVNQQFLSCKIPPLTLQLLIENAVKHNIASISRPLSIHIYSDTKSLVITNNYQPKNTVPPSSGIGLPNIAQRYELLFGETISIENIFSIFKVTLPLVV